jgi:glucose/mannose-6-phosphate isomerase
MYALATGFPAQCLRALEIAEAAIIPGGGEAIRHVVLTGLGGSAAGGDFAKVLFDIEGRVPMSVNRDYALPAWVGPDTLVLATSYSGNTEETLAAFADATGKGARIIVVTSGGELAALARARGVPVVAIPGGQPPRTALGFMLVPVLVAASRLGLLPAQDVRGAAQHMDRGLRAWVTDVPASQNPAKRLAASLHGALGVLYGLGSWPGVVAHRWKGQLNENAKQHVFAHVLPEMNHNEILGWEGAGRVGVARWVVLMLEDEDPGPRLAIRADATLDLIRTVAHVERVPAGGPTLLARMLSLALLGDFVSLYLAALNTVDPHAIRSIDAIKQRLGDTAQPPPGRGPGPVTDR